MKVNIQSVLRCRYSVILYNIFLITLSYMYEMTTVASFIFMVMIFPHEGKSITDDQLMYYKKKTVKTLDRILP